MVGWLVGWMDGWMVGCVDGWIDGWMDEWIDGLDRLVVGCDTKRTRRWVRFRFKVRDWM